MNGSEAKVQPLRVFYSYSHKDEEFRSALETHLAVFRRCKIIDEWHDRMIGAGDDWKSTIDKSLVTADIVLLLVSPDFIASDYCWGEEMIKALERHARGEARVIPVILRPCRWRSTPLASLQAVPKDGKPITDWLSRDGAFDDVAAALERIVEELQELQERRREAARREAEARAAREAEERQRAEAEARRKAEPEGEVEAKVADQANEQAGQAEIKRRPAEQPEGEAGKGERRKRSPWLIALGIVTLLVLGAGYLWDAHRQERDAWPTLPLSAREQPTAAPQMPVPEPRPVPKPELPATAPAAVQQPEKPQTSVKTFRDCEVCPEMVALPGGTFAMGSPASEVERYSDEGPMRPVTIQPFAIGKTEVTFAQWDACVAAGGCNGYTPDDKWGRGSQPVINVSWLDAQAFVDWLSKQTGKPYRLPTEAEWEYAARAGTTTPFSFGPTISTAQANYSGNYVYGNGVKGEDRGRTVPVGSLPPNSWGLYEMHGNVWEWVEDCWHDSYQNAPQDAHAWVEKDCSVRVVRGGSWFDGPRFLRSANRYWFEPGFRDVNLGFRVARTLTP